MSKYYVYLHKRADNGSVFYVGKGSGNRAYESKYRNTHWQRVVAKYGFTVEIYRSGMAETESLELEKQLIQKYGRDNLTNMTDGGEGATNPSLELRQKHSEAMKRNMANPEYVARLHSRRAAITHTPEYKLYMSRNNPMRSLEVRKKVAEALRGNTGNKNAISKPVICVDNGMTFESANLAAEWLKDRFPKAHRGNISTAAKNGNTAYGFSWKVAP